MSNAKEFREKKDLCFEAYLGGETDPVKLAALFGVSPKTVSKWIKVNKWNTLQKEESQLNRQISIARKKALITALKQYAEEPGNTALQSLVSMIKSEQKREAPSKELNDYIIKFLDQLTDFCIEKGYDGLLNDIKAVTMELAEYLRVRNG